MANRSWYEIKNQGGDKLAVSINDEIGGWRIGASEFIDYINYYSNVAEIELSIHSPGGSFLDGLAIYHALKQHPARVVGTVLGLAGSAASMVLMACDYIRMPKNTHIMIHSPNGGARGYSDDLREVADLMDTFKQNLINIYMTRFNGDQADLEAMVIDSEVGTWIGADDALLMGFADEVIDELQVAAISPSFERLNGKLPEGVSNNEIDLSSILTIRDYEDALRDAGVSSKRLATALASKVKSAFLGDPEGDEATEAVEVLAALQLSSSK